MTSQIARAKPVIDELRIAMRKPLSGLSKPWWCLICAAVFFFALALRIAHSRAGLPYIEDDTDVYANSIYMNRRQSLDPIRFDIPSLSYNFGYTMNLLVSWAAELLGANVPASNLTWDLEGWGWTLSNPDFLLANRLGLSTIGATTCLIVMLTGNLLVGRLAGLAGGLLLASVPTVVSFDSRFSANGLAAFFFTSCVCSALFFYRNNKWTFWLLSLLAGGFAAGSKYTGILALGASYIALALIWKSITLRRRITYSLTAIFVPLASFVSSTPFVLVRPNQVLRSVIGQGSHYFVQGHFGADTSPGIVHFAQVLRDFAGNITVLTLIASLLGIITICLLRPRECVILLTPYALITGVLVASAVNRHVNHSVTYPLLAIGLGASVALCWGLFLALQSIGPKSRAAFGILALTTLLPLLIAVLKGLDGAIADIQYKDPRTKLIEKLTTNASKGNVVIAQELRVHPAQRALVSAVRPVSTAPLKEILDCRFTGDVLLALPISVTTWREAAAKEAGAPVAPNFLDLQLKTFIKESKALARFGQSSVVLDYNFVNPGLGLYAAHDIEFCKN
jgi:4-amino-4-deoxy-L-arabinose transferase-like glycosyltransferase